MTESSNPGDVQSKLLAKPRMPEAFWPDADAAIARHRKRKWAPGIVDGGSSWECPYADEDADRWWALLFEIFGTRQTSVVNVFFSQLQNIVGQKWNGSAWTSNEDEMRTLFSMVCSLKPRNEAEAAYAAQLCALHMSAMKLGQEITRSYGDPRTTAILNKTVRAFGDGLLNFQRLRGKGRKTVQVIRVETHRHEHKHVHFQGEVEIGEQPHATRAAIIARGTAVSGESSNGSTLPLASRPEQAGLPHARRERIRRT